MSTADEVGGDKLGHQLVIGAEKAVSADDSGSDSYFLAGNVLI